MVRGLIVPLSPNEEIALRRVAYGSADVAFRYAERLMRLALVEDAADGLRLTSVGQQRIGLLTIGLSGDAVAPSSTGRTSHRSRRRPRGPSTSIGANGWSRPGFGFAVFAKVLPSIASVRTG